MTEFEAHDDSGHDTRALHLRASNKDTSDDPAGHDANDDNGGHNVNDDNGGSGSIGNGTCAYRYVRTGLADGSHTLEINVLGRNSNSTDMDAGDDNPGAGNKEEWSFVLQSFVYVVFSFLLLFLPGLLRTTPKLILSFNQCHPKRKHGYLRLCEQ